MEQTCIHSFMPPDCGPGHDTDAPPEKTTTDYYDCARCPDELPNGYHDYGGYYCRSCSALAYMGSCEDYWYDLEHCFTDGTTMGIGGKVKDYCRCSCYNCDAPAPTTTTTPATTTMEAINGRWSNWGSYGACSKTCGGGTRTRRRSCNNPPPSNGGDWCVGASVQSARCNVNACPCGVDRLPTKMTAACKRVFTCAKLARQQRCSWSFKRALNNNCKRPLTRWQQNGLVKNSCRRSCRNCAGRTVAKIAKPVGTNITEQQRRKM